LGCGGEGFVVKSLGKGRASHLLEIAAKERVTHTGGAARDSAQNKKWSATQSAAPEEAKEALAKLLIAQNGTVDSF
jgi:hypothetical protein